MSIRFSEASYDNPKNSTRQGLCVDKPSRVDCVFGKNQCGHLLIGFPPALGGLLFCAKVF